MLVDAPPGRVGAAAVVALVVVVSRVVPASVAPVDAPPVGRVGLFCGSFVGLFCDIFNSPLSKYFLLSEIKTCRSSLETLLSPVASK
jgi:hypothetical protein